MKLILNKKLINQWLRRKSTQSKIQDLNFLFGMKSIIFMSVTIHKFIFTQLKVKIKDLHMILELNH
jgi:hypothetical protein